MQPDKPSAANSKSLATLPSVTFCCGLGATVCIISAVLVSFGICAQVLVLTTLGLAVPGLLVGIIAALRIAGSFGQRPGMGFVYAGLSMCAIPLLLALVLPALSRPPDPPLHIACRAHMRSIGLALMLYAEENDVRYPTTTQWCDLILPYIDNQRTYRCPAADRDARCQLRPEQKPPRQTRRNAPRHGHPLRVTSRLEPDRRPGSRRPRPTQPGLQHPLRQRPHRIHQRPRPPKPQVDSR